MPKFNVYGTVQASKYLGEFEAATPEEAEELALEANGHCSVCHQCTSEIEDPEIIKCTVEPV
jgi:hypothetical protein